MNSLFKILKNSSTEFTSSEKDKSTRNLKILKIDLLLLLSQKVWYSWVLFLKIGITNIPSHCILGFTYHVEWQKFNSPNFHFADSISQNFLFTDSTSQKFSFAENAFRRKFYFAENFISQKTPFRSNIPSQKIPLQS